MGGGGGADLTAGVEGTVGRMKSERMGGCPVREGTFQAGDRHGPCVAGAESRLVRGTRSRAERYGKKLVTSLGWTPPGLAGRRSSVFILRLVCLHLGW